MKPTLRTLTTVAILALASAIHAAEPALPSTLLAEKAPADAVSVKKARKDAKPGEAIVLRGKIGGRKIALTPKAAIAVLADEKSITSCKDMPGDTCATPWDYCCETSEKLAVSTATVQVRDEKGKVLRATLRGLGELKELSTVVISGTVDAASTKDNLIVNATSIFVEKP
jgi:hypothetical protein